MMTPAGVFVPPICPVEQNGILPDLRTVPFALHTHSCTGDENNRPTETETFVAFSEPGDEAYSNIVTTDALIVPIDSPLADKIRQVAGATKDPMKPTIRDSSYGPRIAKIGRALCDRVAHCHGVTNGECWALGAAGLKQVIEEI